MLKCKRCGDIKENNGSKYCDRCLELFKELKQHKEYRKYYRQLEEELKNLGLRK